MYAHKNGITFRKVQEEDLDSLYELREECWWGTHSSSMINKQDQKNWFDKIQNDSSSLAVIGAGDNYVGLGIYANIDHLNRSTTINAYVFKENRGKYAKEAGEAIVDFAFEILNMNKVHMNVLESNLPSFYVVKSLGFKIEGNQREAYYKSGRYLNNICFGMTRNDWLSLERVKSYNGVCNLNVSFDEEGMLKIATSCSFS